MEPHPARSKAHISEKLWEVGDDGKGDGEVPWGSDFGKVGKQGRETKHKSLWDGERGFLASGYNQWLERWLWTNPRHNGYTSLMHWMC